MCCVRISIPAMCSSRSVMRRSVRLEFPLADQHFRAPIQAIFALTDALLEFLQIFPTLLSFLLEFRFGAKPMLFTLQQRLFALALSILHGLVSRRCASS